MQPGDKKEGSLPARFVELKRQIVPDEESKARITAAWSDLLGELRTTTDGIKKLGPDIIPQVDFAELQNLTPEQIDAIKRRGTVVIKNVVDDDQVICWREELKEYIKINPVEGFPEQDKQFFELYWTKPQVQARAHPNVLQLGVWLNNLYHLNPSQGQIQDEVLHSLNCYRFSTHFLSMHPGVQWTAHPPHIDGAAIERWEDPELRNSFGDILNGNWRKHDPYNLAGKLQGNISMYGRPEQASVFRTFRGWLAMSDITPNGGTLQVFPDVLVSNAYIILRPFFKLKENLVTTDSLDPENWVFDMSTPDFPGIYEKDGGYFGPRLTPETHPHLRLEENMTSVPIVEPGDMVFWHCDVVHAVEKEHTGNEDSSVMYIPAVPLTAQNLGYIQKQKEAFLKGETAPDFPKTAGEGTFIGVGKDGDIVDEMARRAMGLAY